MMAQILRLSCSWCNMMNDVEEALAQGKPVYCIGCGHRGDVDVDKCDCKTCGEFNDLLVRRQRRLEKEES
jgi:hypothetical protein